MSPPEHEPRRPDHRVLLATYERARARYLADPTDHHLDLLLTGEDLLAGQLLLPGPVDLGRPLATPGAVEALRSRFHAPAAFLLRHKHGDWGDLDPEDRAANRRALVLGGRLLSVYPLDAGQRLWVITESDRSATTLLLPEEY